MNLEIEGLLERKVDKIELNDLLKQKTSKIDYEITLK